MLSYSYIKASYSLKTVWIRALAFNALIPCWTFLIQVSQIVTKKSLKNSFFCEKSIKSCCPNKFSRTLKLGTFATILRAKESLKISKLAMFEPKRDARNVIAKNCNDSLFKSSQHFSARAALHSLYCFVWQKIRNRLVIAIKFLICHAGELVWKQNVLSKLKMLSKAR